MLNSLYLGLVAGCIVLFLYRGGLMARIGAGSLTFILVFGVGYLLGAG